MGNVIYNMVKFLKGYYLTIVLVVISWTNLMAQNQEVSLDSLTNQWTTVQRLDDMPKIDSIYHLITERFSEEELENHYYYSIALAKYLTFSKNKPAEGLAIGLKLEEKLKNVNENHPDFLKKKSALYSLFADSYYFLGNLTLCLQAIESNLSILKNMDLKADLAVNLAKAGILAHETKQYQKALSFQRQALPILLESGNKGRITMSLGNMGNVYADLYQQTNQKAYLDSSQIMYHEYRKYISPKDTSSYQNYYLNMAQIYKRANEFELSELYFDSLSIHLKNASLRRWQIYYRGMINLHFKTKNKEKLDTAFLYYDRFIDSAYAAKLNVELDVLKSSLEQECILREEKQTEELNAQKSQSRLLTTLISASLLLMSLLAVLFYQMYLRRKKQSELYSLRQRLLRSQMNPHFTFNTLANIKALINEKETKAASKYLTKFSSLLRISLDNSVTNDVYLDKEIEAIQLYLELQKIRFGDSFTYDLNIDIDNAEDYVIPTMLLQPFVENCFKHAFKGIDYTGHIDINLKKDANNLICEILDNGVGLQEKVELSSEASLSYKITRRRLELLKHNYEGKGKLELLNNPKKTTGAMVKITIPYRLEY